MTNYMRRMQEFCLETSLVNCSFLNLIYLRSIIYVHQILLLKAYKEHTIYNILLRGLPHSDADGYPTML